MTASLTPPWLGLAIWIPILAGLVVMATGRDENARIARVLALIGAVAGFAVTIPLYTGFDLATSKMQFVELRPWIEVMESSLKDTRP